MDILTDVLSRVHLNGTLLFHYELGYPWSLAVPQFPVPVFHYLIRGTAIAALGERRTVRMEAGDFVLITRGEPHIFCSDRRTKPYPLLELDRRPAHLGVIRHGGGKGPLAAAICGNFSLSRSCRTPLLQLFPPLMHLRLGTDDRWLETILQAMVNESAVQRPGQEAVLSRMTEVLFIEVLRTWIKTRGPGEGGWLAAMSDPHIGKALQLIHQRPERTWTLSELAGHAGLGRSAFSARFTRMVGKPMHRYLVARRMDEAALMLETSGESIARIADRVGYETPEAFSKVFKQHYGSSPGSFRARKNTGASS
jgi:AraC-like DNA-binding protein